MSALLDQKVTDNDDLNPSVRQWAASRPDTHVWVSASAGTGKTKVLTDRVLRLLLPSEGNKFGTPPHRILCLTYTKAAASEMMLRINHVLAKWVIMPDDELAQSIRDTTGSFPDESVLNAARRLFSEVVDCPGGLKIMTIHSFCQSVLGRFPLEAGISPHIKILDETVARTIIKSALISVSGGEAYKRLSLELDENKFMMLLQEFLREEQQLQEFLKRYSDKAVRKRILQEVYRAKDLSDSDLILEFCKNLPLHTRIRNYALALEKGSNTDQERAQLILDWLSRDEEGRVGHIQILRRALLTSENEPRALTKNKDVHNTCPDISLIYKEITDRMLRLDEDIKAVRQVDMTLDLIDITADVQEAYTRKKEAMGALDYNDLLLKTLDLLKHARNSVQWVLFKLDEGLDHILVDEAQDTSPVQWEIIALISEEFFHHQEISSCKRTLFIVGDEKQSIYRFQGASLEDFQKMRAQLESHAKMNQVPWRGVALQVSFRSTRSVLEFVDQAFNTPEMKSDIGLMPEENVRHYSNRIGHAGKVCIWPLITPSSKRERPLWNPPLEIVEDSPSPRVQLANYIAAQIEEWIQSKRILESKGRAVRPGDILVLMRARTPFVEMLIRALKSRKIPVSGADRLVLNNTLVVQDLISLVKFALQPEDDLSLAEILKSPFIGMRDEELEDLAYGRDSSLWARLQNKKNNPVKNWLYNILNKREEFPLTFFLSVLNESCPAHSVSGYSAIRTRFGDDCLDVLDEFLVRVQTAEDELSSHLQGFLLWHEQNKTEIKRELDGQEDAVRIMTVHGAKGLQAPIVILPDTLQNPSTISNKIPRLLMPGRTGLPAPLWAPRKDLQSEIYKKHLDVITRQEIAEYKRLFYVAVTRAEDELYIGGAASDVTSSPDSWYFYANAAFERLGNKAEDVSCTYDSTQNVRVYAHAQDPTAIKTQISKTAGPALCIEALPDWLYKMAPPEKSAREILRPSYLGDVDQDPVPSLCGDVARNRFRRGILIHKLLEYLPDTPSDKRQKLGAIFLNQRAADLSLEERVAILDETLQVMSDPVFSEIFSARAQSEVSLAGLLPSGYMMNGQIDRLLVDSNQVLVIDYKTNRPPPARPEDVSSQYKNQLRAYRDALKQIYPDKRICTALLWTYGPKLMHMDDIL